jgi:hypothetical protein
MVGVLVKLAGFPEVGVRETPLMVVTKARRFAFAGGARGVARIISVTVAVPPPPPQFTVHGVFSPLQEVRAKIAEIPRIRRARFEFMQTPHINSKRRIGRARWLGNPRIEF